MNARCVLTGLVVWTLLCGVQFAKEPPATSAPPQWREAVQTKVAREKDSLIALYRDLLGIVNDPAGGLPCHQLGSPALKYVRIIQHMEGGRNLAGA